MASGCPVAAAAGTAVEEVAGDAAVYFSPDSTDEMAAGMLTVLRQADDLARQGLTASRRFTWKRAARLHDAVYADLE